MNVSGPATAIVGNVYHHHHLHLSPVVHFVHPSTTANARLQQKAHSFDRFELLSGIGIDAYTVQSAAPDLFTCIGRSMVLTPLAREDEFTMLYIRSRQCIQLTVSLITTVDSQCWQLVESQQGLHTDGISDLPCCLISRIEDYMNNTQCMQQTLHLKILADRRGILVKTEQCRQPAPYGMRLLSQALVREMPLQSCA